MIDGVDYIAYRLLFGEHQLRGWSVGRVFQKGLLEIGFEDCFGWDLAFRADHDY